MTSANTRAYAPLEPSWSRFHVFAAPIASSSGAGAAAGDSAQNSHPYNRQYSHVYSARLQLLRKRCIQNAQQALKDNGLELNADVVDRIIEVKEGTLSILVGTVVKEMDPKRRPQVKGSYTDASAQTFLFPSDGNEAEKQEPLRPCMFDKEKGDVLHLEDESGRVELSPDAVEVGDAKNTSTLDPNKVATGIVAAVVGKVDAATGVMHVHSIHFAGPPPVETVARKEGLRGASIDNDKEKGDPILLLVSGLGCGSDSPTDAQTGASLSLRREMLLDYLTDSQLGDGSSICRVVVAGGGITAPVNTTEDKENTQKTSSNNSTKSKSGKYESTSNVTFSLRELDLYLTEILSSGIPVDYIPGWNDPTNANWPQRPLHSCLLPNSVGFIDLFRRSTNPYESACSGVTVLGSDGLNVADLRRFLPNNEVTDEGTEGKVSPSSSIDALQQTFNISHMAPTGPDSLPMFPSSESDPFLMTSRPSVYFAGNCDEFEARLVGDKGESIDNIEDGATRLVCVPSFASTGEVVKVNLRTLECEVISFNDV